LQRIAALRHCWLGNVPRDEVINNAASGKVDGILE